MSAQTLMEAIADAKGNEAKLKAYIAHLESHRERILAARDKVAKKAKADPKSGAAHRLKQYDATLERYERELKTWAMLKAEEN